jgi:hypothetical protein
LPNGLIDALPLIESLGELKVILYVLRHTWGYQEYQLPKRITLDEFEHGRKMNDGTRLDSGVGMAKNSIKDGISRAIDHGFLQRKAEGKKDFARSSYFYSLVIAGRGQDLTLEGQKLTKIGSEIDHRTEKETFKETLTTEVEQSFDGQQVDESDVMEWFEQRKQVKPVHEQLTEEEYKERISQAIVDSAETMVKDGADLRIENYLTTVPEPLARAFCYKHGRPPTKKEDAGWRSNWNEQIEIGLTPELVEDAYMIMEQDKLTIRAPSSVNAVAERVKREGKTASKGGQVVKMGDIEYQLPKAARVSGLDDADKSVKDH